jgi:hypothetical protein
MTFVSRWLHARLLSCRWQPSPTPALQFLTPLPYPPAIHLCDVMQTLNVPTRHGRIEGQHDLPASNCTKHRVKDFQL